jgi:hypothetical protein
VEVRLHAFRIEIGDSLAQDRRLDLAIVPFEIQCSMDRERPRSLTAL